MLPQLPDVVPDHATLALLVLLAFAQLGLAFVQVISQWLNTKSVRDVRERVQRVEHSLRPPPAPPLPPAAYVSVPRAMECATCHFKAWPGLRVRCIATSMVCPQCAGTLWLDAIDAK